MGDPECAERAQLWSVYFAMRGLIEPPPFLASAQRSLWCYLDQLPDPPEEAQPPPKPQRKPKRRRRSHLSVIGGGS